MRGGWSGHREICTKSVRVEECIRQLDPVMAALSPKVQNVKNKGNREQEPPAAMSFPSRVSSFPLRERESERD